MVLGVAGTAHRIFHAHVIRLNLAANLLIAHAHACAADAADDTPLQQADAFPRHRAPSGRNKRSHILPEGDLIALELIPVDIAGMSIADQDLPVFAFHLNAVVLTPYAIDLPCAPVGKGAGITGIV